MVTLQILILMAAGLIAYAVGLELRKRVKPDVLPQGGGAATPTPVPHPCFNHHTIIPIAVSQFRVDEGPRTTAIYRCSVCTCQISALYHGTFELDDLARTKAPVEELEQLWKQ